jgi:hypothetical protein
MARTAVGICGGGCATYGYRLQLCGLLLPGWRTVEIFPWGLALQAAPDRYRFSVEASGSLHSGLSANCPRGVSTNHKSQYDAEQKMPVEQVEKGPRHPNPNGTEHEERDRKD